ncbi:MAG: cytidine deaminase [Oscillospiraceae bacterium]|jgi:cytidine deaminase|nr:cytidine deaminase [Oscillospiraceae bacterium]
MRVSDRELINMAALAKERAYSPYSGFPTGAAIECEDGSVFIGCRVENPSPALSVCAETAALTAALSAGQRIFKRIAIASDGATYCMPCGGCRQVLHEFSPDMEILASRADGRYVSYRLTDLFPRPFGRDTIKG